MRRLAVLLPVLLAGPLAAQQKIERRFAVNPDVSIRVTNMAGATRIIGWDRDSVVVIGTIGPRASFFGGGRGGFAKLGVERPDETLAGPGSTLEIWVPRGARLLVKSGTASVDATGLTGELQCAAVSGAIRVDGALRLVVAESMEGNLEISGPNQITRLTGGSGTVTLRGPRGDLLATTVAGSIIATGGLISRAHLETVSGAINYDGSVDGHGTLENVTHSGDVTLRLPATLIAEFELQSFEGKIETDLFPKGRVAHPSPDGRPWTFATGAGGAQITVRTFKGQIRALKQ